MDTHEFDTHDGLFAADEFADETAGFGLDDDRDLPPRFTRRNVTGEQSESDAA